MTLYFEENICHETLSIYGLVISSSRGLSKD